MVTIITLTKTDPPEVFTAIVNGQMSEEERAETLKVLGLGEMSTIAFDEVEPHQNGRAFINQLIVDKVIGS